MKKLPRALALGTLCVLALSGCVRLEMNFDVQSDNSVDTELISAFSQAAADESGVSALDGLWDAQEGEAGVVIEPYESEEQGEDGEPAFVGTRTTLEGQTFDELDFMGGDIAIVRDGDDFVVSGTPVNPAAELGGEMIPADADITMSFTFPGDVSQHNGELEGSTVTWDLITHTGDIQARGAAETGGFPLWLVIVIVALVGIGIGMAGVLVAAGKRKPTDDARPEGDLEGEYGIQGTVNTADAGEGTVAAAPEPVVEGEHVVDTTDDEGLGRA